MVVSIDKATALKMYDKVRKHWEIERKEVEDRLGRLSGSNTAEAERVNGLRQRLQLLTTTDMAVVVSTGQNEIEQMRSLGLDIVPHRKRMNEEKLDEKFKDSSDPFRLVFVCAMWLTGFDAQSCSTIYLDKPMRNHTLMQTIARANRVFPGKHSGLIVDYANVLPRWKRHWRFTARVKTEPHRLRIKVNWSNRFANPWRKPAFFAIRRAFILVQSNRFRLELLKEWSASEKR